MTPEQIQAIRERLSKATQGPWCYFDSTASDTAYFGAGEKDRDSCNMVLIAAYDWINERYDLEIEDNDAEFIANAPQDIAALLGYVAALQEENRHLDSSNAESQKELKQKLEAETKRVKELEELIKWKNEDMDSLINKLAAETERAEIVEAIIKANYESYHKDREDLAKVCINKDGTWKRTSEAKAIVKLLCAHDNMADDRDLWKERAEEAEATIALLPCNICLYADECIHDKPYLDCKHFELDNGKLTPKEE